MDQDQTTPENTEGVASGSDGPNQSNGRSGWIYVGLGAVGVLIVVGIVALLSGALRSDDATPPAPAASFISIVDPGQGAILPVPDTVTIRGQAGGLFENGLVVQALDNTGSVLAQEPTTTDASEPGSAGSWSVEMVIPVQPGTTGLIFASSTSPEDGQIIASDSIEVTYGVKIETESAISIVEPKNDAVLNIAEPVTVSGAGQALFENNVVVEALDGDGNVLAQKPTTMQTEEVGGAGVWSVDISIPAVMGTSGTIRAWSPSGDGGVAAEAGVRVQYGEALPEPTNTPEAVLPLPPTETPKAVLPLPTPGAEILDRLWRWVSLQENQPPSQSVIPDPENYDLILHSDGTFNAKADCNSVGGTYAITESALDLQLGPHTPATCDEGSLSEIYIALLDKVDTWVLDGVQLLLGYDNGAGTMGFN